MSPLELFSETKLFMSNCFLNTSSWMPHRHSKVSMSRTELLIPPRHLSKKPASLAVFPSLGYGISILHFSQVTNLESLNFIYFKLYIGKPCQQYRQSVSLTRPKPEIRICSMAHPFHAAVLVRELSVVTLLPVSLRDL